MIDLCGNVTKFTTPRGPLAIADDECVGDGMTKCPRPLSGDGNFIGVWALVKEMLLE